MRRRLGIGDQRPGPSQHLGLGRRLIEAAASIAAEQGFDDLAVISSVGTREYYRRLAFRDGELYQHRALGRPKFLTAPPAILGAPAAGREALSEDRGTDPGQERMDFGQPGADEEEPCAE